jgi:hypothetical protein
LPGSTTDEFEEFHGVNMNDAVSGADRPACRQAKSAEFRHDEPFEQGGESLNARPKKV